MHQNVAGYILWQEGFPCRTQDQCGRDPGLYSRQTELNTVLLQNRFNSRKKLWIVFRRSKGLVCLFEGYWFNFSSVRQICK